MRVSPSVRRLLVAACVAVVVITVPMYAHTSGLFLWETVAVQMLFATSVALLFGHANMPSFGQAAFFGVGAYAAALLAPTGLPLPLVLLVAALIAGAFAALVGVITVRATGLAFSMLTLAIAQSLYTLVFHVASLGGEDGITPLQRSPLGPLSLTTNTEYWYFLAIVVVATVLAFRVVQRSPFGFALRAIRDDPVRAASLGVNLRAYRVAAFVIAGIGGGIAGGLFAFASDVVTPDLLYWTQSGNPIIMSLIGGLHSFAGPLAGAALFTLMTHQLGEITPTYILYVGIVFLGFLVFLPEGLVSLPRAVRGLVARAARRPTTEVRA